jgi:hypothetical protein
MISSAAASNLPTSARKFAGRMSLSVIKAPSAVLRISLRCVKGATKATVNAALAVLKRKRVGHVWDMNQRLTRADGSAGRARRMSLLSVLDFQK